MCVYVHKIINQNKSQFIAKYQSLSTVQGFCFCRGVTLPQRVAITRGRVLSIESPAFYRRATAPPHSAVRWTCTCEVHVCVRASCMRIYVCMCVRLKLLCECTTYCYFFLYVRERISFIILHNKAYIHTVYTHTYMPYIHKYNVMHTYGYESNSKELIHFACDDINTSLGWRSDHSQSFLPASIFTTMFEIHPPVATHYSPDA